MGSSIMKTFYGRLRSTGEIRRVDGNGIPIKRVRMPKKVRMAIRRAAMEGKKEE